MVLMASYVSYRDYTLHLVVSIVKKLAGATLDIVFHSLLRQGWKIGLSQTGDHSAAVTPLKTSFT